MARRRLVSEWPKPAWRRARPLESRIKLARHAIHPMLIVIPLGVLATSVIFDIIRLITSRSVYS